MQDGASVTARELKVHTGEILSRVAEGAVVYVTRHGKTVARLEPVRAPIGEAEQGELEALIEELHGSYRRVLPSSTKLARAKHAEERRRDRRW